MQARYDLFNKLCKLKSEIEIQLKNIVLYKNSKLFNQQMKQIIPQFDIAFKQIPKTISFNQDQKPIALQDFLIKFQQKINHRKESLLNRYLREIQQIKAEFINTAKKATSKSIEFIEDSQQLEQRFKRQLSLRKRSNLDAIESLMKHQQKEINFKEIEEKNLQIKNNEQNRIISIKQNELATLKLQIEQLKQEINDQKSQNLNNNDDIIEKKKESNQQKIDFLKNQKNDEIDLIKRQIEATQSNIQSVTERISNLKKSQIEMKSSFQSIIDHFNSQSNQQTQLKISQIKDEIQSNQNKIFSLKKKIEDPIVPLNKEAFELELQIELKKREEKLKFNENNKKIEFENQILSKIIEQHSILKEIQQIESKTAEIKEKVEKENQIKIENLKKENQNEIKEINNELIKQRKNFLLNSNEKGELIHLQAKITDFNIKMNQLEQEEKDFNDLKNEKEFEKVIPSDENVDFSSIFDSFSQKEINNNKKIHLIESKLKGQLDHLHLFYDKINEKARNDIFEKVSLFELEENEKIYNKINQEKEDLLKIENKINNLFLSIESAFEIIDELQIKIEKDENEDKKEKERFKKLIFELNEKYKNEIQKLHSIIDDLNNKKRDFLHSNQFQNIESEFIEKFSKDEREKNYLKMKSEEIELIKNAEKEIKNLQENNLKEIEEDNEILFFFQRKEIESYYQPIINLIKKRNHFLEELMKFKLKIKKREFLNIENEENLIFQLRFEISNLERHLHELETSQAHHVSRKIPLPPLKDS